jgi:hypothetical protein
MNDQMVPSSPSRLCLAPGAITAIVFVAALMASGCYRARYTPPAAPQQLTTPVVEGSFTVTARNYAQYKVVVSGDMTYPRLEGTFTASGGANNDVEVALLDETQFLNWQNRHTFKAMYESGRVTADKIRVSLPMPGTYFLVFSNRFSLLSRKTVAADVKLHFARAM